MKVDTRGTRRPCSASATRSLPRLRHPQEEAAGATSQPQLSRGPHFDLITKTGALAVMAPSSPLCSPHEGLGNHTTSPFYFPPSTPRQACSREDVPLPGPQNPASLCPGNLAPLVTSATLLLPFFPQTPCLSSESGSNTRSPLKPPHPSINIPVQDFPGGAVDKNQPANDLGISHMLRSS